MNILIFAAGAALVYFLQMLFCRVIWNYHLQANASFSEKQAREGDTINLTITLENGKFIPLITLKANVAVDRGLTFKDVSNLAISDKNYRSEIFSMNPHERVVRDIPLFCSQRGFYHIDHMNLVGNDLFYSRRFLDSRTINSSVCVFPGKADARQLMIATQKMSGETVVPRSDCDDPFTFRGIRQYQSYDSIRDINWKATARTGDLRVNIHDFTSDQEIGILLDTEWDSLLRPDSLLEESIRIAASLADEFIGQGILTSLFSNGQDALTDEYFSIQAGANAGHIQGIMYGLARIRLAQKKTEATMEALLQEQIRVLESQPQRKVSWVLISTETNDNMVKLWQTLESLSVKAYWIVPAHNQEDVPVELYQKADIMYWEVPYGR